MTRNRLLTRTIYVEPERMALLRWVAASLGVSYASLVRAAIDEVIAREEAK